MSEPIKYVKMPNRAGVHQSRHVDAGIEHHFHPVAVIDPSDMESVGRLAEALDVARRHTSPRTPNAEVVQAALREYADPKPAECWAVKGHNGSWWISELSADDGYQILSANGSVEFFSLTSVVNGCGIDSGKPDEPLGWLALVKDSKGCEWVRDVERGKHPWSLVDVSNEATGRRPGPRQRSWADIDAVEVLSEGVE